MELSQVILSCYHKTIKKQTAYAQNFLQLLMQMCEMASIPYIKINMPFSAATYFLKIFSTPRINKMINKHIPRIFLGFYLCAEYLLNFLSKL